MKRYDMPEALMKTIRGLYREKRRLCNEVVGLKAQHDEVMRRFHAGTLAGNKARALTYAIHDRLELLRHELIPLVESRTNELALEYAAFVRSGGGRLPDISMKMPARARRPGAGDELLN